MLFHIQSTHSYKTCGANDPEKKKIMRSAFLSTEENGVKIHFLGVNRKSHTVCMVAESETFEEIDKMFEPILTMTDPIITPVMLMTLD
jgi:hypothetical protein